MTYFTKYLWGGNFISTGQNIGPAHEIWLDTYDYSGIIPYTLIIIYTCSYIIRMFKIFKNKNIYLGIRILSVTFYIVMTIQFGLEPILEGSPILFYLFCFLDGFFKIIIIKNEKLEFLNVEKE
ncbi:MAG: hypothetical protein ACPKMZ_05180 [Pleomorphochaeta sp.]